MPCSTEGLRHRSISALIPGWQGRDASKSTMSVSLTMKAKKETYIVQLNCHICGGFSTELKRKKTHTIREFLDGFTKILETAHDISQTCSSPKAKLMIIKYQVQFARDVKEWLTIAVSIAAPYQLFLSRELNEM